MNGWKMFLKLTPEQKIKFLLNFNYCPFNSNDRDIMTIFDNNYPNFRTMCRDAFAVTGAEGWDYWDELIINL